MCWRPIHMTGIALYLHWAIFKGVTVSPTIPLSGFMRCPRTTGKPRFGRSLALPSQVRFMDVREDHVK
jgi:hypothetical protein